MRIPDADAVLRDFKRTVKAVLTDGYPKSVTVGIDTVYEMFSDAVDAMNEDTEIVRTVTFVERSCCDSAVANI